MTREEQLEASVRELVAAMNKSEREGSTDHLDCHDDAGEFWHGAIERANELLARS